jgi:DNA-binding NtrC family response regulator
VPLALVMLSLALIAEPDRALRFTLIGALRRAGYEVRDAANTLQLKLALFSNTLLLADDALLVLDRDLASQCLEDLVVLQRLRSRVSSPAARFVLLRDARDMRHLDVARLDRRQIAGVLAKPVDLTELESLVRRGTLGATG